MAEEATAVSEVSALIAKANFKNANEVKSDDFNRWQLVKRQAELAETIPPEAARIYVRLLEQNRVPDWVRRMCSEKDMRLLAGA